MPNGSDKDYPLYDFVLNLQTDCTPEEAVAIMLGLMDGIPALLYRWYGCLDNYGEEIEDFGYSLQDDLEAMRNSLISDYGQARMDKFSDKIVAERFEAIKKFDTDYINKARIYLCHIDDELAKGAESKLRLSQDKARGSQVLLTLKSLDEWASKEY